MSTKVKVLVADDSLTIRSTLVDMLSADPDIEIVGTASNGKIALDKVKLLKPDILTLDVEMPELDGLATLERLVVESPDVHVIMCTAVSEQGGRSTLDALSMGADDYIAKPSQLSPGSAKDVLSQFSRELIARVKAIARKKKPIRVSPPVSAPSPSSSAPAPTVTTPKKASAPATPSAGTAPSKTTVGFVVPEGKIKLVVIGASTGGPTALAEVLSKIPPSFPVPVAIVQHMPPLFTRLFATRLSSHGGLPVVEATEGEKLVQGRALLAPGDFHMTLVEKNGHFFAKLNQDPPVNYCRPAVDVLFNSAAQFFGKHILAVILTGMGQDGMKGCQTIREARGKVIVQDEATSVVWGMPGAVANAGFADKVAPLNTIAQEIMDCVYTSQSKR